MNGRAGKLIALIVVVLSLVALTVGCQGQQQGTDSTPTPPASNGQEDQSLRIEIVEQWAASGHARPITFAAEEEGCKNCHDGLTFTTTGGGFQPRIEATATGTTEETDTAGDAEGERDWVVATDCRVCHTEAGVEIADAGSVEGIPSLDTAEGGMGALCMACHNGWHGAGPGQEGNLAAPHYSVQTDMLFGVNTMEVASAASTGSADSTANAGEESTASPHAKVPDTCVGCHLAGGDDPNHLFRIESYAGCEGQDCHDTDMTDGGDAKEDYDNDGRTEKSTAEVEGLMETLSDEINKAAGSSSFASEGGDVVFEGGGTIREDDPAYAAAYNYLYVDKDKSMGIHNMQFTVKLLRDSIATVSAE